MTLSIGIDLDDVLYPFYDTAHAACRRAGITNGVTPTRWKVYLDYGCTAQDWHDVMAAASRDGSLWGSLPIAGALSALWRLHKAGHYLHIVTARGQTPGFDAFREDIERRTLEWLLDNFVPYDSLTFSRDKTVVATDYFVEDNLANYDAVEVAGSIPFLVTRPWNLEPFDKRRRVGSLGDFADFILVEGACSSLG